MKSFLGHHIAHGSSEELENNKKGDSCSVFIVEV